MFRPKLSWLTVAVATCSALLFGIEHVAEACSGVCIPANVRPDGTAIPSNANSIAVYFGGTAPFTLRKSSAASAWVDVPFTVLAVDVEHFGPQLIVPTGGFEPDAEYQVTVANEERCVVDRTTTTNFRTIGSAPLPTAIGTLKIAKTERGLVRVAAGASCWEDVDAAQVAFELDLDPSAKPWAGLFRYETIVDGVPWIPRDDVRKAMPGPYSWQGPGKDLAFSACSSDQLEAKSRDLDEGMHSVVMRATLLSDSPVVLETSPLSFTLACNAPPTETTGAVVTPNSASTDAASLEDGSCSTALPRSTPRGGAWLTALVVGTAAVARRRHRARNGAAS